MLNFDSLRGARDFEFESFPYLKDSIERFFGCRVSFLAQPIERLQAQGIDITATPRRGVYQLPDKSTILLGRIIENRSVKAAFSLRLTGTSFSGLGYLLNMLEAALAQTLSRSAQFRFVDKPQQFGDDLLELAISKHFSKGYFDHRRFLLVIDLFRRLSNTAFEGRNFTTGLILTPSFYAFAKKGDNTRFGTIHSLEKPYRLEPEAGVEKRFWYLADGQTSYFMADNKFQVRDIFLLEGQKQSSFIEDYSLISTVKGRDALFRVTSRAEFSVLGSDKLEFTYKDNRWCVRNLPAIAELIRIRLGAEDSFVQRVLYFAFLMSRRRSSAILWIPNDLGRISEVMLSTRRLTTTPLSILKDEHAQSIFRLLSSDGATIVSLDGSVVAFGSFVDISKAKIAGLKGTGETVSSILSENGLALKISQDGAIKMYDDPARAPIVF